MTAARPDASRDPARFLVTAAPPQRQPLLHFRLHLADRPAASPGQRVEAGQPLVEHFREPEIVEIPTTAAIISLRPGDVLDRVPEAPRGRRGQRPPAPAVRARLIEHGRDGISRFATGRGEVPVISPVAGFVEALTPSRLDIRADGLGIEGRIGWGRPATGRVVIAANGPDAEMRASAIDVGATGAILVVGVRIDVEAMSRARAIGVAAVVSGGIAGPDLRQLDESEVRQQAALHAAAPFALLAVGGHGRTAVPRQLWDLLVAAEGRQAGILPSSRSLVVAGDPAPLIAAWQRAPGTVRVTGGERRDEEGRLVGLSGLRRWPGGAYAPGGFVELSAAAGPSQRVCLPLFALERLG